MSGAAPITLLRLSAGAQALDVVWADGTTVAFPYVMLRERCPCAACRQQRRSAAFETAGAVAVTAIEPLGANAVQLIFSDGHRRGIYPFPYLRELRDEALTRGADTGISK